MTNKLFRGERASYHLARELRRRRVLVTTSTPELRAKERKGRLAPAAHRPPQRRLVAGIPGHHRLRRLLQVDQGRAVHAYREGTRGACRRGATACAYDRRADRVPGRRDHREAETGQDVRGHEG